MARRRVLYALALMGGALFFLCFEAYASLFVLALLLGLPLLSLLLTLPVLRGAELTLSPQPGRLPRRGLRPAGVPAGGPAALRTLEALLQAG